MNSPVCTLILNLSVESPAFYETKNHGDDEENLFDKKNTLKMYHYYILEILYQYNQIILESNVNQKVKVYFDTLLNHFVTMCNEYGEDIYDITLSYEEMQEKWFQRKEQQKHEYLEENYRRIGNEMISASATDLIHEDDPEFQDRNDNGADLSDDGNGGDDYDL